MSGRICEEVQRRRPSRDIADTEECVDGGGKEKKMMAEQLPGTELSAARHFPAVPRTKFTRQLHGTTVISVQQGLLQSSTSSWIQVGYCSQI